MRSIWPLAIFLFVACAHARVNGSEDIGTRDAVTVLDAAPDGRWVALCQAREDTNGDGRVFVGSTDTYPFATGDELKVFLVEGTGIGFPIDHWIGADASGQRVAFVRNGEVVIRDTASKRELALMDAAADRPVLAFSPEGKKVAYLLKADPQTLALRDVSSGQEQRVHEDAPLLTVRFDRSGKWLLEWYAHSAFAPDQSSDSFDLECLTRRARGSRAEPLHPDLFRATGDVSFSVNTLWSGLPVGGAVVFVHEGSIIEIDPDGKEQTLLSTACGPELLFEGAASTLGVRCKELGNRLVFLREKGPVYSDVELGPGNALQAPIGKGLPRLIVLPKFSAQANASDEGDGRQSQAVIADTQRGDLFRFERFEPLAEGAHYVLGSDARGELLLDLEKRTTTRLSKTTNFAHASQLPWVADEGNLINLDTGRISVLPPNRTTYAVRSDGFVLVGPERDPRVLGTFPIGPLTWLRPAPESNSSDEPNRQAPSAR